MEEEEATAKHKKYLHAMVGSDLSPLSPGTAAAAVMCLHQGESLSSEKKKNSLCNTGFPSHGLLTMLLMSSKSTCFPQMD